MTDVESRTPWKDWLPAVSVAVMLIGALLTVGGMVNRLATAESRITAIEAKQPAKDDQLNKIDLRTVRIETKLEMLMPAGRPGDQP